MIWLLYLLSLTRAEYKINYDRTDYPGVATPQCGPEIELVKVEEQHAPSQIRLSYTTDCTEMSIMWTTSNVDHINIVNYGLLESSLNYSAIAISHSYTWYDGYKSGYIHEALLINLEPGMKHFYQIISNDRESAVVAFTAAPRPGATNVPISFFHTGDVGVFGTSVMVTANMLRSMEEKDFHGMVHCGDIAYSNKFNGSKPKWAKQEIWDTWGEMVEPLAKKVPYMVAPGNHEMDFPDSTGENITIYTKRFIMPGNERYYSFSVGMVHFVAVNTDESIGVGTTQGKWFENKLKYINENRKLWPWLVVFQHRPIYNSNKRHGNWTGYAANTRPWDNPEKNGWPGDYEGYLMKYGVDLVLNGHVHHYERTWPTWNRSEVVQSTNFGAPAPIYITCGHGGKSLYNSYTNKTTGKSEPSYGEHKPKFVAARDNEHWGHCELEFKDQYTLEHKMYHMGSRTPAEVVTINRKQWVSSAASTSYSTVLALFSALLPQHPTLLC